MTCFIYYVEFYNNFHNAFKYIFINKLRPRCYGYSVSTIYYSEIHLTKSAQPGSERMYSLSLFGRMNKQTGIKD